VALGMCGFCSLSVWYCGFCHVWVCVCLDLCLNCGFFIAFFCRSCGLCHVWVYVVYFYFNECVVVCLVCFIYGSVYICVFYIMGVCWFRFYILCLSVCVEFFCLLVFMCGVSNKLFCVCVCLLMCGFVYVWFLICGFVCFLSVNF